jgi:UDP-N-acetylmuramoylalanine-D-glutamate ligase
MADGFRWLMANKKVQLQGKQVTVFGLNRSGIAAAKLLYSHGAVVTLTDTRSREALSAEMAISHQPSETISHQPRSCQRAR